MDPGLIVVLAVFGFIAAIGLLCESAWPLCDADHGNLTRAQSDTLTANVGGAAE